MVVACHPRELLLDPRLICEVGITAPPDLGECVVFAMNTGCTLLLGSRHPHTYCFRYGWGQVSALGVELPLVVPESHIGVPWFQSHTAPIPAACECAP